MTQLLHCLLTALLLTLGPGNCTGADQHPDDPGRPAHMVGTSLVTWDESQIPDLSDNHELPTGPVVISTEAERDRLLDSEPLGPALSQVADVDLEDSVLVVAGYHSCQERGAVWTDGKTVWWDALVPAGAEHIACAWSPFTVDITEVPRSTFSGEPALVTPPWDR